MNYYIVVVCSVDWYHIYDRVCILKANSKNDAIVRVMNRKWWKYHHDISTVVKCGTEKPTRCN